MKRIIPVLFLAGSASAQSGLDFMGYVAAAFGLMSLIASYQLIYRRNGLDEQIAKKSAFLTRLQDEVREAQERLTKVRKDLADMDGQAAAVKKATLMRGANAEPEKLRKEYWDHLQKMDDMTPTNSELRKLMEEKADVEHMVEMTKSKYLEWSMDEKSFNNIIEGYQKRIIELETMIHKIKGEKNGN